MKILVTGGTGFVGSHLVEQLLADGHDVTCLVRSEAKAKRLFPGEQPTLAVGDLDSATPLSSAAKDADVVFHVAALTAARNRAEFHRVNIQGTQTVARVIEAHARTVRRFIYVSSLAACGPTKRGTVTDASTKPQPVSQYGWSKLAAEEVIKRSRLPWVITRPPTVYGPRDTELLKVFKLAKAGIVPVFGDGTQTGSFVHVSDLVSALIACMDAPENRTYFPSHPIAYTQRELVGQVSNVLRDGKSAARVVGIPNAIAKSALWMTGSVARLLGRATLLNADRANDFLAESWVCSPHALEHDVGWTAQTDLPSGLGQTAEWYLANGWL